MPYFLFLLGDQGDGIANSVRCTSMSGSSISNEEKYGSLGYFLQATHLMCKSNKVGRGTTSVAGRPDVQGGDRTGRRYIIFIVRQAGRSAGGKGRHALPRHGCAVYE